MFGLPFRLKTVRTLVQRLAKSHSSQKHQRAGRQEGATGPKWDRKREPREGTSAQKLFSTGRQVPNKDRNFSVGRSHAEQVQKPTLGGGPPQRSSQEVGDPLTTPPKSSGEPEGAGPQGSRARGWLTWRPQVIWSPGPDAVWTLAQRVAKRPRANPFHRELPSS